jgi:hypothetical protein
MSLPCFLIPALCGVRVSQMTKTYNDIEAVTRLLEEVRCILGKANQYVWVILYLEQSRCWHVSSRDWLESDTNLINIIILLTKIHQIILYALESTNLGTNGVSSATDQHIIYKQILKSPNL